MDQANASRSANGPPDLLGELLDGLRQNGKLADLLASAAQPNPAKPPQGALAGDILYGADAIAEFLYGDKKDRRKVYNLIATGSLPHFRLGAGLCSRKSVLLEWIARQEQVKPAGG